MPSFDADEDAARLDHVGRPVDRYIEGTKPDPRVARGAHAHARWGCRPVELTVKLEFGSRSRAGLLLELPSPPRVATSVHDLDPSGEGSRGPTSLIGSR
jgi:hypothetical protein